MSNSPDSGIESYSEEETKRRAEAALKRMLATPHKPHEKVATDARRARKRQR